MSKNKQKKDKARNADKIFLDEREISKIGPIMEQYGVGYTVFSCSYKLTYRYNRVSMPSRLPFARKARSAADRSAPFVITSFYYRG